MKGYLVKILVLLFALMLTLALFTACTKNNDGDKENISGSVAIDQTIYSYIVNEDGTTCTITAVEGDISADWVFPSSLDGYAVTIIGDYAFKGRTDLVKVDILNTITTIGFGAFSGCDNITEMTLPFIGESRSATTNTFFCYIFGGENYSFNDRIVPKSLRKVTINDGIIEARAFYGCRYLTEIVISENISSIGDSAFGVCKSLKHVDIPDSVITVGDSIFIGCQSLECNEKDNLKYLGNENTPYLYLYGVVDRSIVTTNIDENCRFIGYYAFNGCKSLVSVEIPDSVVSIGSGAFLYLSSLTSVTIGSSVKTIYSDAFSNCYKLLEVINKSKHITVEKQSGKYGGVGYYALSISNCDENYVKRVTNNDGFSVYNDGQNKILLGYYGSEPDVILPADITAIYQRAFENCNTVKSLVISDSVESIGEAAFFNCTSLQSVTFGCSITSIPYRAFQWCNALVTLTIPDTVKVISADAFSGCVSLVSIDLGNGVTTIGWSAFFGCSSIKSIIIPESVMQIEEDAFRGCNRLVEVINKSTAFTIVKGDYGNGALGKEALSVINRDDNYVSKLCTENDYVIFADGQEKVLVDYIGKDDNLVLPEGITKIKSYALTGYWNITSIVIPSTVTSIGEWAFTDCYKLAEVINKSQHIQVKKGSQNNGYVGYYALTVSNCDDTYTSKLSIDEGFVIYSDGNEKVIVSYVGTATDLTLPSDVTRIGQYAFLGSVSLTSVVISNSVTEIEKYAFYGCFSLKSVIIPESVVSVGESLFQGANSDLTVYCKGKNYANDWPFDWDKNTFCVYGRVNVVWGYKG